MVIFICDNEGNAAVLNYASWKCSRVTRSVLAAEIYAFATAFDFTYTLQHDMQRITGHKLPIIMFTDSMCLFDTITRLTTLTEKRLLIDTAVLRDSYAKAEIYNIGHVSSEYNLEDWPYETNQIDVITRKYGYWKTQCPGQQVGNSH